MQNWQSDMLKGQTAVITGVSRKIGIGAAIARALANNPKLILADEPTGNLDTQSSENVQEILQNLVKTHGCSVVVVTHDPEFAKRCDRTITIVDGAIIKE